MFDAFSKIIPVILIFGLGIFLRKIKLLEKSAGDVMLKIVFNVSLPALIIVSISEVNFTRDLFILPIISAAIILLLSLVSQLINRKLQLPRPKAGVFIVGTMIMNIGFAMPFIIYGLDSIAFVYITIFDVSNALITYTYTYLIACRYGEDKTGKLLINKILAAVPLWTLLFSLTINMFSFHIPDIGMNFFKLLGDTTVPLVMLSLGIYFSPRITNLFHITLVISIRMLLGFLIGYAFVELFDLQGLIRTVVLIGASAPVGYNTLVFASLEKLDKQFAASVVSISILIGLFTLSFFIITA